MRTNGIKIASMLAVLVLMCAGMVCMISDDDSNVSATETYTRTTTNLTVGVYASGTLVQYEEITTNGGCVADNTYTGSVPGLTFVADGSFSYSGTPTEAGTYSVTIGVNGFMSYQYLTFPFVVSEATTSTKYTVTFVTDGTSCSDMSVNDGESITLPTTSKDGYTFNGWFTSASGGTQETSPYKPTSNVTLYAQWTENTTPTPTPETYYDHKITYMDGSNTLNTQNNSTTSNGSVDTVINYAPSKTGYEFKGRSVSNGSSTADYQYGSTVSVPTSGITLYAVWKETTTPTNTIVVKIDGVDTTMQSGSKVSDVAITPKSGFTFDGWYSEATFTNKLDDSTVLTNGMYLFSKWTQNAPVVEKITITVDGKSVQMDNGKKVSDIEEPTKDGYKFIGWYSDEGLTKAVADDTVLTNGMTLYSKFSQKTENDLGMIVLSIMVLLVGIGMMYEGYRLGNPIIMILGLIIAVLGGLSIGLEKSGSDLITWFKDLFNGGRS